jgi:alcohol dehydrogenase
VLIRNRSVIEERITRLSRYLELDDASFDGFLSWVLTLREQLNIPHTLAEIGINLDDAVLVGKMSAKDAASAGNPIILTDAEYSLLFSDAVKGQLK